MVVVVAVLDGTGERNVNKEIGYNVWIRRPRGVEGSCNHEVVSDDCRPIDNTCWWLADCCP